MRLARKRSPTTSVAGRAVHKSPAVRVTATFNVGLAIVDLVEKEANQWRSEVPKRLSLRRWVVV